MNIVHCSMSMVRGKKISSGARTTLNTLNLKPRVARRADWGDGLQLHASTCGEYNLLKVPQKIRPTFEEAPGNGFSKFLKTRFYSGPPELRTEPRFLAI